MQTPPDYKELENEIAEVVAGEEGSASRRQQFEEAGRLRDQEKELLDAARRPRRREIKAAGVDLFDEVDEESIAEVLSIWTGIPVYKLTEEETAKLLRMEDELHKRVIGQEDAIKAVSPGDPPHPCRPQGPEAPSRARSSSSARRASGRPSWPRRSPSSCSATRQR